MNYAEWNRHDDTPPAPDAVEPLVRFLNLHDHIPGAEGDVPPPADMVRAYLLDAGLLEPDAPYSHDDHSRLMELFDAIHSSVVAREAGRDRTAASRRIEDVARRASFRLRFDGEPALEPVGGGVDAAIGRLLVILFLAERDGGWTHVKECASTTCHSVFYDRSKNRSGKWCSMQSCGNKHKVRAWRERHRADAVDA